VGAAVAGLGAGALPGHVITESRLLPSRVRLFIEFMAGALNA
jgi:hypothetical protein